jgi:hypothetical protein
VSEFVHLAEIKVVGILLQAKTWLLGGMAIEVSDWTASLEDSFDTLSR